MSKKRKIFIALIVLIFFSMSLFANIDKGTKFIGTHIGFIKLTGGEESSMIKGWWGLDTGYFFSKRFGFELNGSMGWARPGSTQLGRSYITYLYPVTLNMRFNFTKDTKVVPYGLLGSGMLYWDVRDVTNDTGDYFFTERRGIAKYGAMQRDAIVNTGLGLTYFLSKKFGLDVSARYHMIIEHGMDMSGNGDNQSAIMELRLGLSYFFGGVKDTDHDGICDKLDRCPDSPRNIEVDEYGCAIDSDNDGVPDYEDKCDNTPSNIRVNALGCPVDSDKDGIKDDKDKCPNTPRGVRVDAKGCPVDSDRDGIPDYKDRCKNTLSGVKVDKNGCPIDKDFDGVPDYRDNCPNTARGVKVDKTGCPVKETPKVEFKKEKPLILKGITFDTGKSNLTASARQTLMQVLNSLKENHKVRISINGYTDNTGSVDFNISLSKRRAEAVKNFLIKNGISANRLSAHGYGPKNPIASNKTREGRAKNRRIEFMQVK